MAVFSDEEKMAVIKAMLAVPVFNDQETAILTAIVADYETKAVGIAPDDGVDRFRTVKQDIEDSAKNLGAGFTPVTSSNLAAVRHNPKLMELVVRFRNGTAYLYRGVDRMIYDRVLNAESPGGVFQKLVVKGGFTTEKLENWK